MLSQKDNIVEYAIIESALVSPIKGTTALTIPTYKLFYHLIKQKWFAKMQAKTLFVPNDMFEQYYEDSLKINKQSLINITLSNGNYELKDSINKVQTKVLIIVGSKELKIMRNSAQKLHSSISNSRLYIADNMGHGEISLVQYKKYLLLLREFLSK